MIELLAPAGDLSRLKIAIDYGADAVYLGGIKFGLRKGATNFTKEEMVEGIEYAHKFGKKVYVTLNIIPHDEDLVGLDEYIKFLSASKVDGVIVSDPGILMKVKELSDMEIHISTQGSVTNAPTANFWYQMGARRIVLARELDLNEIKNIRQNIPDDMVLEAFCHGAMCMSYSGRCLISSYMTGRDPNRGDCAHPCRYKYHLVEEKRPGEYFPIEEVDGGTYLMNSRDLKTIEFIEKLIQAGIYSLKIEGRIKSSYYIATILRAYRLAIDEYLKSPDDYKFNEKYDEEIEMTSHRPFTSGFYFGNPGAEGQYNQSSKYFSEAQYKADVVEVKDGRLYIYLKNGINEGDTLEIIGPKTTQEVVVKDLRDEKGKGIERANVPKSVYSFLFEGDAKDNYFVRKVVSKWEDHL